MEDVADITKNTVEKAPLFDLTDPVTIALLIVIGCAVFIIITGKGYARYADADNFRFSLVVFFTLCVWDFFTDLLFTVSLYDNYVLISDKTEYTVLFVASVIFIIGPLAKTFYNLFQFQDEWRDGGGVLSSCYAAWLLHHGQFLYLLSFLSGSTYAAINLVNSNFLGHKLFSMGLSQTDLLKFNQTRLVNVVVGENVPQLVIQVIFAYNAGELTGISLLAVASSVVSICIAVLKHINRKKSINDDKNNANIIFIPIMSCGWGFNTSQK
eukprot:10643_1